MNRSSAAALLAALSLIGLYAAYHLHEVLTPFGLSFALAYLMDPVINHFEARGLKRAHLVILLYLAILATVSVSANFVLPKIIAELSRLQERIPAYFRNAKETMGRLQTLFANRLPVGRQWAERWSLRIYSPWMDHIQDLPGYLLSLFPFLSLIFLVPFISFYMLTDSQRLTQQAIQACPGRRLEQILHFLAEIDVAVGYYIRGVLLEALAVGLFAWIGLQFLHLDYALAIASLTAVAILVPYAGPAISALTATLVAAYQYGSFLLALKVLILCLLIWLVDHLLLQPLISRHSIRLHPLAYLLALMTGAHLFGFIGLILAAPTACALKALLKILWLYRPEGPPYGPRPATAPERIPYI